MCLQAPEEFLDPLTQELMDDPVILPSSGHTVDRSSIMRHLLRFVVWALIDLYLVVDVLCIFQR